MPFICAFQGHRAMFVSMLQNSVFLRYEWVVPIPGVLPGTLSPFLSCNPVRPLEACFKCASGPRSPFTLCYAITFHRNCYVAFYVVHKLHVHHLKNSFLTIYYPFYYCQSFVIFLQHIKTKTPGIF
jgi:hypothetical protein